MGCNCSTATKAAQPGSKPGSKRIEEGVTPGPRGARHIQDSNDANPSARRIDTPLDTEASRAADSKANSPNKKEAHQQTF